VQCGAQHAGGVDRVVIVKVVSGEQVGGDLHDGFSQLSLGLHREAAVQAIHPIYVLVERRLTYAQGRGE
jgi:hypothetical protein